MTLSSRGGALLRSHRATSPGKRDRSRARDIVLDPVQSNCIENGAHDASAGIAQHPDRAGRIGNTGVVLACQYDGTAGPESQALRVRVQARRRCIEKYDVELVAQFAQQRSEER